VKGRLSSARKGRGSGVGSPRVPFCGLLAAEEQSATVLSDAGGRRPLYVVVRRGASSVGATSCVGDSSEGVRRWWRAQATENEPGS
jgi:hypothetical protein